jgi:addiction module HigA family antidote
VSIVSFSDDATEEFFFSGKPRKRPGWLSVANIVKRKLDMIHYAARIDDLKSPPGDRLQALRGDLAGWHSVRVNDQWRVLFRWTERGAEKVRVADYHRFEERVMMTTKRKPTSPGEILREEFLVPLHISQKELSEHIGCDFKVINRIINERSQVTPTIAIKLAAAFNTTPDFWLNAQKAVDLYHASRALKTLPKPLLREAG